MTHVRVIAELDESRRRLYDLQMQMIEHAKLAQSLSEAFYRMATDLQRARDENFNARDLIAIPAERGD